MKIILYALFLGNVIFIQGQTTVGIQLYSFRAELAKDVPGTLQKIHDMGFSRVEGGSSYGLSVSAFRQLLAKNKLNVVSLGADFNQLDTGIQAIIKNAHAYGSKYVVCTWIPHDGNNFTLEDAQKAITVFNHAGKILKDNGLRFCYHPHGYEFRPYKDETLFDYMAKLLNPDWVNFEMDVFWIKHPGQDPVKLLKRYSNRFLLMHLKDRRPGTPGNQNGQADPNSNVVLGTGDVGIADIIKVAKTYGVKQFFIEDESNRSMVQVPQSLAYLRSLGVR